MQHYINPAHWIITLVLIVFYLVLAILFFLKKNDDVSAFDRALAQVVRFGLLIAYITGLFKTVTLGQLVHTAHHIVSAIPLFIIFGIRFLPSLTKTENTTKTYAWMFLILAVLMVIIGLTSKLSVIPTF